MTKTVRCINLKDFSQHLHLPTKAMEKKLHCFTKGQAKSSGLSLNTYQFIACEVQEHKVKSCESMPQESANIMNWQKIYVS